jgi:hypothetical protein
MEYLTHFFILYFWIGHCILILADHLFIFNLFSGFYFLEGWYACTVDSTIFTYFCFINFNCSNFDWQFIHRQFHCFFVLSNLQKTYCVSLQFGNLNQFCYWSIFLAIICFGEYLRFFLGTISFYLGLSHFFSLKTCPRTK